LKPLTLNKLVKKIQEKRQDFRPITLLIQLPDVRIRDNQDVACLRDNDELEVQFADIKTENNTTTINTATTINTSPTNNTNNNTSNIENDTNLNVKNSPNTTADTTLTDTNKSGSAPTQNESKENEKNTVLEVETLNTKEDNQNDIIWSAFEQQPATIDPESFL